MLPSRPVYHALSRIKGTPDAYVVHPDGAVLWRLHDHWFFAKDCEVLK